MTRAQSIGIRRRLNALPGSEELNRLAAESGLIRRRRKLDPTLMFWTLVLGFGVGRTRSLAGLRRVYERVSGVPLAASSFPRSLFPCTRALPSPRSEHADRAGRPRAPELHSSSVSDHIR